MPTTSAAPDKIDDEFDVDREQPREEKKFEAINSSQKSLTTVNEQNSDFNDTMGAVNFLNQDNNSQAFQRVAELTATQKRDD